MNKKIEKRLHTIFTKKEFKFIEFIGGFFGLLIGIVKIVVAVLTK